MSIETKKCKSGCRYRPTVYHEGVRHRGPWFKRKVDAVMWEDKVRNGYQLGTVPTFLVAAEDWLKTHCLLNNKPATVKKNQMLLRELYSVFGKKSLNKITTRDIERHMQALKAKGLSNSSMNQRVQLIKAIYNWHMKRGVNVFNPAIAIRKLKNTERALRYWTRKQCELFLSHAEERYSNTSKTWIYNLYLLALNTGLRWGEILGLDWSAIDLQNRRIRIDQVFDEAEGKLRSGTKSGRIRYVGINDTLYTAFYK